MSQESTQVVSGNDTQPRHLGLPFDIVEHIAQYMPISKVRLAVLEWCTDEQTKKAVLHRRSNILLYMRHFFREPAKVLDLMRACGVIWSGSRAQEFFTPGASTPESSFSFYCMASDGDKYGGKEMFTHHMQQFGVTWELGFQQPKFLGITCPCSRPYIPWHQDEHVKATLTVQSGFLKHEGGQWPVKLIHHTDNRHLASSSVFNFPSTVTQAFISGYGAVSLYDDYTSNYEIIRWPSNERQQFLRVTLGPIGQSQFLNRTTRNSTDSRDFCKSDADNASKSITKFFARGFKLVEYGSRGFAAHGHANPPGPYSARKRSIRDSGVLRISFKPYLTQTKWNLPFEVYWKAINNISWYETAKKTACRPEIMEIFDPDWDMKHFYYFWDKELQTQNKTFKLIATKTWADAWLETKVNAGKKPVDFPGTQEAFAREKRRKYWSKAYLRYPC